MHKGRMLQSGIYTKKDTQIWMSFFIKVAMTYSPTKLQASVAREAGSSMAVAVSHAKCGAVTPRGVR